MLQLCLPAVLALLRSEHEIYSGISYCDNNCDCIEEVSHAKLYKVTNLQSTCRADSEDQ